MRYIHAFGQFINFQTLVTLQKKSQVKYFIKMSSTQQYLSYDIKNSSKKF